MPAHISVVRDPKKFEDPGTLHVSAERHLLETLGRIPFSGSKEPAV